MNLKKSILLIKYYLSALLVIFFIGYSNAQPIGGKQSFQFLNLPGNAQLAAIGGMNLSTPSRNVAFAWQNPALLSDTMTRMLSVNYIPFYADIKGGAIGYVHRFKKLGPIAFGLQYINYGSMTERDETGTEFGSFRPQDVALLITKSHTIGVFTMGATAKYVASSITPAFSSYALLADLGGIYKHPTRDFYIGMTLKNVGFALVKYEKGSPARAPFDVQLGTSYKLEHLPLRLSLTAHRLYKYDIAYFDSTFNVKLDIDGNPILQKISTFDKVARHFVIGTEFLLHKNFNARIGYNIQRRREMRLENKVGGSGFSWGFRIRLKSFEIDYARATYHLTGGRNWISITTDFNRLLGKN